MYLISPPFMAAKIRKVSFFFPLLQTGTPNQDKQLVRAFMVGQSAMSGSVVEIEERNDPSAGGEIYFDIYVSTNKDKRKLWKSYTAKISDIEREYEI